MNLAHCLEPSLNLTTDLTLMPKIGERRIMYLENEITKCGLVYPFDYEPNEYTSAYAMAIEAGFKLRAWSRTALPKK